MRKKATGMYSQRPCKAVGIVERRRSSGEGD